MSSKVQQSVYSDCVTYAKSKIKFNTFNTFNNVDNLKVIAKNAGAAKTGVEIETEDGYLISIYVTKRQNKK